MEGMVMNVRHASTITSCSMGGVWDVWEWRIVHSTTVIQLNVLMGMTSPIAINQTIQQVVQIMCVCMGIVGMGL
jgi:hypothetical protein